MAFTKHVLFVFLTYWLVLQITTSFLEAAPEASLIKSLPGFNGTFPSKHYSGYVTLDTKPAKNLFYYFIESERNPTKDPVVLWLNGGPGCSSFDGFVYEHGPFNFEKGKNEGDLPILHLNPFSWSKVSNIIYLDSPSGVGFSYPKLETGDLQTANDTHAFLLKWFKLYPEFQPNQFYITGESYAGIYIPTLIDAIDKGKEVGVKPGINLKGYMIGNGVCDDYYDGDNAFVPFAHGMGLISESLYKEAYKICRGDFENKDRECQLIIRELYNVTSGLNIYNILEPCYHGNGNSVGAKNMTGLPASFRELGKTNKPLPVRNRMFGRAWPYRAPVRDGLVPTWAQLTDSLKRDRNSVVPCYNDEVATRYLTDKDVRKALHVSPEAEEWIICADPFRYYHNAGSMLPYHKNLTAKGYRTLIYR
ncbi:OLC1v1025744C1 [Oldenlandia corymbosa var. corymbosa]|uniref:Carboxypeptidase n=1 Tax=Oldenlandia corymbosa var. corymbosa TaxID=529605 RepID=A0AAV1C6X2_OLDCO|nr:OLC1v1025744C1 [Oldenlandia corymbosa var. corymbosa]